MPPQLTHEQLEAGRAKAIERRRREGEMLRKKVRALLPLGLSKAQIAAKLGVTRQAIYKIVKELEA